MFWKRIFPLVMLFLGYNGLNAQEPYKYQILNTDSNQQIMLLYENAFGVSNLRSIDAIFCKWYRNLLWHLSIVNQYQVLPNIGTSMGVSKNLNNNWRIGIASKYHYQWGAQKSYHRFYPECMLSAKFSNFDISIFKPMAYSSHIVIAIQKILQEELSLNILYEKLSFSSALLVSMYHQQAHNWVLSAGYEVLNNGFQMGFIFCGASLEYRFNLVHHLILGQGSRQLVLWH